jgi:hypothetical protein
MMSTINLVMTVGEVVSLSVVGTDGAGNTTLPAATGTDCTWAADNTAVAQLNIGVPDTTLCLVTAVGVGETTITVTGGVGGDLTQTFLLQVVSPLATALVINVAAAGVQPAPSSGSQAGFSLGIGYARPNL